MGVLKDEGEGRGGWVGIRWVWAGYEWVWVGVRTQWKIRGCVCDSVTIRNRREKKGKRKQLFYRET